MKITSDDACRLVVKAAWLYREYEHAATQTGPRTKSTAIARSRFYGIADAADVLNLAMTPFAFFLAFKDAFEKVGDLEVSVADGAERAKATRLAWTDAMYDAVRRTLT